MPWTCPKSWPRGRCAFREGGGGSISRAVAHFSDPNVSVHLRRTLCAVRVERLVRIFILAARLFHSQLQIVFSSAESGRISGQADLHIFYPNVSVHRRRLVRRTVERLVGSHFHRLFLASLSEIVPAGFVTFVSLWWKVHCARGCQYIS